MTNRAINYPVDHVIPSKFSFGGIASDTHVLGRQAADRPQNPYE